MANCSDAGLALCVADNPALGLNAVFNFFGAAIGLWFLVMSYMGLRQWTSAKNIFDLLSFFWNGLTSVFRKGYNTSGELRSIGGAALQDFPSARGRVLYFIGLALTVTIGVVTMTSPGFGIAILVIGILALVGMYRSTGLSFGLITPLAGGAATGLFVVAIVWFARFFRVRSYNAAADTISIVVVFYVLFGMLAIYGAKGGTKKTEKEKEKLEEGRGYAQAYPVAAPNSIVVYSPPVDRRRKDARDALEDRND